MNTVRIRVSEIVGGGICVAASDGQKLHNAIHEALSSGYRVELSFANITRMTTAFLNAAVGQLYGEFDSAELQARLAAPVDYEPWQLNRLVMVIQRAKSFFQDQEGINKSAVEITGMEA